MNWKIFLTVCISLSATLLPYNIIGCGGGDEDPYDYFVSFFDKKIDNDPLSQPFFYTNYQFLYDEKEPVNLTELTSSEWISYAGIKAGKDDAYNFVCKYTVKDVTNLYNHIEKNQPLTIADSLKSNPFTGYFISSKDLEALGYLIYAKKLEPHVTGSWSSWEPIQRDSVTMGKLMRNGQQLYNAAKKSSIKLRYAYQVLRLAHYSKRYQECLNLYEQLVKPIQDESVLQDLCISLQAGAMQHLGKKEEAAYTFSKLFNRDSYNRISNYMSFDWSVSRFDENNRKLCLQFCKTDKERAGLLALFALGSNQGELDALQEIYKLDPTFSLLKLLTIREVHKIEDYYFTPSLAFQSGDTTALRGYEDISKNDPAYLRYQSEATSFVKLCERIAAEKKTENGDLYLLAAAHTSLIIRDFKKSASILKSINVKKAKPVIADQVQMTNILVTINSKDSMDAKFEEQLLPSIKWLMGKAKTDPEYEKFYRRLFVDVLASKYKTMKGNDHVKYLLCLGVADKIVNESKNEGWGYSPSALFLLREKSSAAGITKLIELVESNKLNAFEKFLVTTSAFTKNDLNDIAGTTSLREYDFAGAIKWLSKVPASYYETEPYTTYLAANPFADQILDTHQPTEADSVSYTRLSFAKKMLGLKREAENTSKAKTFYELAKGYYHMSYWGNSWLMGTYSWSGSEYEYGDKSMKQDYFNVDTAKAYYLKAYNASTDNNFKAKALFMAAKCDQKQVGGLPGQWNENSSGDYQKDLTAWLTKFDKRNSYFSTLSKTYRTTAFFKEAQRTCSYLDDFVKKMKK